MAVYMFFLQQVSFSSALLCKTLCGQNIELLNVKLLAHIVTAGL